jgi:hypothetical protein
MTCVDHLKLNLREIQGESEPAREGTAVGEYLSEMIRQGTETPVFGVNATNGYFVNEDMKFYARETYRDLLKSAEGNPIKTEERIDWYADSVTIRGQYDASFVVGGRAEGPHRVGATLHVEDLKYGWGIVEAKDNWQLLGYAIGEHKRLLSQGIYIDTIVMRIHQPRPYHPEGPIRTWTITLDEMFGYYHQVVSQVRAYYAGGALVTGSACKYCDAAAACPALNKAFHQAVDIVTRDYEEKELTNDDIAKLIAIIDRAEEVIEIKSTSVKQLAMSRLQNNQVIPGYGMVQKFGDRAWKPGITAETIKMMTGVDITKTDMMSPAQAEKAGLNKKMVAQIAVKPPKGFEIKKVNINEQADKLFNK